MRTQLALVVLFALSFALCRSPGASLFSKMDIDSDGVVSFSEYHDFSDALLGEALPTAENVKLAFSRLTLGEPLTQRAFLSRVGLAARASGTKPVEIHLALTGELGEMRVVWVTTRPAPATGCLARYGSAKTNLTSTAAASQRTYNVGLGGFHGTIMDAVMTGLAPGVPYFYSVECAVGESSEVFRFFGPSQDLSVPRKFAVFGDMGTAIPIGFENAMDIARDVEENGMDAVVHVGDLAYAGTGAVIEVEEIWDVFGQQTEGFAARVPYMTGTGNHERYFNFSSFSSRYHMPSPWNTSDPTVGHQLWFSFRVGGVHFSMMSTEHPYTPGSSQWAWLEADLAKARADPNVQWLILTGHRPMYSTDKDELSAHVPGAHFQTTIEPLLVKYKVDIYFSGHQHAYERVHPVINGTVLSLPTEAGVYESPKAPLHCMQGTGGTFTDHDFVSPSPPWSAVRASHIGYGRLTVHNATFLEYEYLSGKRVNDRWAISR